MKESESSLRSLRITTMDEFDWIRIMCDYDTMPDFRGVLFSYDYTIQIVAVTSVCKISLLCFTQSGVNVIARQ